MKAIPPALICLLLIGCAAAQDIDFEVTDIIIYPQGTGLVASEAKVPASGPYQTMLPAQAYDDSIRLLETGGKITLTRTSRESIKPQDPWSMQELLHANLGQDIQVMTYEGEYSGKLAWYDAKAGILILDDVRYSLRKGAEAAREAAHMSLRIADMESMSFSKKPALPEVGAYSPNPQYYYGQPPKAPIMLSWKSTGNVERQASLSYLAAGMSWKPVYFMDLADAKGTKGKARFAFLARIENALGMNLTDVGLKLIAGNVNMEYASTLTGGAHMRMEQRALSNVVADEMMSVAAPSIGGV